MRFGTLGALILMAGCVLLFTTLGTAQEPGKPVFAAPKRIKAGDAYVGQGRIYPSPVLHDVDGDEHLDILVGDLTGRVTVARRVATETGLRVLAETPLKDRNGKPLKFHNW
jgi:hypothetical protein